MDTPDVKLIETEGRLALMSWVSMTGMNMGSVLKNQMNPTNGKNFLRLYCQATLTLFECRFDGVNVDQIRLIQLQEPTIEGVQWYHDFLMSTEKPDTLVITGKFC